MRIPGPNWLKTLLGFVGIGLVGIAVLIPSMTKFPCKARQSEVKTYLSAIYRAEKRFHEANGRYTADLKALGLWAKDPPGEPIYLYGFAITASSSGMPTTTADPAALGVSFGTARMVDSSGRFVTAADLRDTLVEADRFVAGAVGNADGDATLDIWSIDETKSLRVLQNDCTD